MNIRLLTDLAASYPTVPNRWDLATGRVESLPFGQVLHDNPRNLIHLNRQKHWTEDLA